mgnify:CR=1 FL=1
MFSNFSYILRHFNYDDSLRIKHSFFEDNSLKESELQKANIELT